MDRKSDTSLDAMIAQWNEELDADTVTNLTDEEQVAVRTLLPIRSFLVIQ